MSLGIPIHSPRERYLLLELAANGPDEWERFNQHEKYIVYTSQIDISEFVTEEQMREYEDRITIESGTEEERAKGMVSRLVEPITQRVLTGR